ncbi:unnamed protein product [Arabidopsis halleri]
MYFHIGHKRKREEQEYSSKTVPVVLPFARTLKLWEECDSSEALQNKATISSLQYIAQGS